MDDRIWTLREAEGPVVAVALHHGHRVRPDVADALAIDPADRLREEDPQTGFWTSIAATRVVVHRSRFELDLNRPREEAVYPAEVWGLRVWKGDGAPPDVVERSLGQYDAFYRAMDALLQRAVARHGRVLVLDLHSYNHRREGPGGPEADPAGNPDVNVGSAALDRGRWGGVADAFVRSTRGRTVAGRRLDVRENVRFQGGWFSRWVNGRFPRSACALAIDVKKFFMDEWTGQADPKAFSDVGEALRRAVRPTLGALRTAREAA